MPWFEAPTTTNPGPAFSQLAGCWLVLCFHGPARGPATRAMLEAIGAREDLIDDLHAAFSGVVADPGAHAGRLLGVLAQLPRTPPPARAGSWAPVLLVPMVFEPAFCCALIGYFETHASVESGFIRQDAEGRTTTALDHAIKRRRDCPVEDPAVIEAMRGRLVRRLFPEIRKALAFEVTRIERYGIVRYDAEIGGHFRQHRDDTTPGTAHRRLATTINRNAEDHESSDLHFPEYDRRVYRAPSGGARSSSRARCCPRRCR